MADLSPELGVSGLPGMGPRINQTSRKFLRDNSHHSWIGIRIDDAVVDSGSTPTTHLRGGLCLVRVEAAGANQGKYVQIGHADAPASGDIVHAVILRDDVNMLNKSSVAEDKVAVGLRHGFVIEAEVLFGTVDAPTIAAIKDALPLVEFEVALI